MLLSNHYPLFLCLFPIVRQFSFIFIVLEMSKLFVCSRHTKYANCRAQQNLLPSIQFLHSNQATAELVDIKYSKQAPGLLQ